MSCCELRHHVIPPPPPPPPRGRPPLSEPSSSPRLLRSPQVGLRRGIHLPLAVCSSAGAPARMAVQWAVAGDLRCQPCLCACSAGGAFSGTGGGASGLPAGSGRRCCRAGRGGRRRRWQRRRRRLKRRPQQRWMAPRCACASSQPRAQRARGRRCLDAWLPAAVQAGDGRMFRRRALSHALPMPHIHRRAASGCWGLCCQPA